MLEIRWSAAILAEVVAHLTENIAGFDAAAGARLVTAMNGAFPAAEVEPDAGAVEAVAARSIPRDVHSARWSCPGSAACT